MHHLKPTSNTLLWSLMYHCWKLIFKHCTHNKLKLQFRGVGGGVNITGVNKVNSHNLHLSAACYSAISAFLKCDRQVLRMLKEQRHHPIHCWSESETAQVTSYRLLHPFKSCIWRRRENGFHSDTEVILTGTGTALWEGGNLSEASPSNQTQGQSPTTPAHWYTEQHFQISGIH